MNAVSLSTDKIISYKGDVLTGPAEVNGYEKLDEKQKILFEKFLRNFYGAWEFPENHRPVKVRYIVDKIPYLRVDFEKGGWLHIQSPTIWY
ncbi:MAG TPA: hypothetical protein VN426_05375 [Syntrophomonadaceae bacterium]|nr:hypothetical protein [Syntrophomonadaceae bacterium]